MLGVVEKGDTESGSLRHDDHNNILDRLDSPYGVDWRTAEEERYKKGHYGQHVHNVHAILEERPLGGRPGA